MKGDSWEKVQQQVQERDDRNAEYRKNLETLSNKELKPEKYKTTDGEKQRLAEKDFYNVLANGPYMKKIIAEVGRLTADMEKENGDPKPLNSMKELCAELNNMMPAWQEYTASYMKINAKNGEAARESESAERFLTSLRKCERLFEGDTFGAQKSDAASYPLMKHKVSDNPAMIHCYVMLKHLSGHYEEMTRGGLTVPPDAYVIDCTQKEPYALTGDLEEIMEKEKKQNGYDEAVVVWKDVTGPLFPHLPTPNDLQQGYLGDCYFISSMSAIAANNPKKILDMMRDNGDGTVTMALNELDSYRQDGKKIESSEKNYIKLRKSVPVIEYRKRNQKGEMETVKTAEPFARNSLWAKLGEKGYAMSGFHLSESGGYVDPGDGMLFEIEGGRDEMATATLLGVEGSDGIRSRIFKEHDLENGVAINAIGEALKKKDIVTASSSKALKKKLDEEVENITKARLKGDPAYKALADEKAKSKYEGKVLRDVKNQVFHGVLVSDHAYTVTGMLHSKGEKYVVVRNPHANTDYDGKKKIDFRNYDPAKGEMPNGYCIVPAKEFHKLFDKAVVSEVLKPFDHVDQADGIRKLSNDIFKGLEKSRSFWAKLSMKAASKEFRNFYKAAKNLKNMVNSPACAERTVEEALKLLNDTAKDYYDSRKERRFETNDRNTRVTLAKAAMDLNTAYLKRQDGKLKEDVRAITENILSDRLEFGDSANYDPARAGAKKADFSKKVLQSVMGRLGNDEIVRIAIENDGKKIKRALDTRMIAIRKQDERDKVLRAEAEKRIGKEMNIPTLGGGSK